MSTLNKETIYLVITSIHQLGELFESFRDKKKALCKAREKAKTLAKDKMMSETLLPRLNPDCLLQISWDHDDENTVTVMRTFLN